MSHLSLTCRVAGGPTTDVVVIGEFLEAFVAPGVSPAMDEQQDRGAGSPCSVWQVNVQAVPRVGSVSDVSLDGQRLVAVGSMRTGEHLLDDGNGLRRRLPSELAQLASKLEQVVRHCNSVASGKPGGQRC